jgi:hypothetical protein
VTGRGSRYERRLPKASHAAVEFRGHAVVDNSLHGKPPFIMIV